MPERHAQVPRQAVALQQREAVQPARILHRAGRAGLHRGGRERSDRLGTDAAHQRERRLPRDHLLPRSAVWNHACATIAVGRPCVSCSRRQPLRFADLVVAVPFGFAVHRGQHVVPARVAAIVVGQVVALQPRVVAQEEVRLGPVRQPGIVVALKVPQMVVGVDQRDGAGLLAPAAMDRRRPALAHTRVPPSTISVDAVQKEASSEASQRIGNATSRGSHQRRCRLWSTFSASRSCSRAAQALHVERRQRQARAHRIDAHLVRRLLEGERARHRQDAGLGDVVLAHAHARIDGVGGRHVDDRAAARPAQRRQRLARQVGVAQQVHRQDLLPGLAPSPRPAARRSGCRPGSPAPPARRTCASTCPTIGRCGGLGADVGGDLEHLGARHDARIALRHLAPAASRPGPPAPRGRLPRRTVAPVAAPMPPAPPVMIAVLPSSRFMMVSFNER